MYLTFVDGDVTGTHCSVSASLLRTSTGSSGLGSDIVDYSSNSCSGCNGLRSQQGVNIPENFDFDASYYWVDVVLTRDSVCLNSGNNPAFIGISIKQT